MKRYNKELIIIGILLIVITAVFYFTDLDVRLEKHFYDHSQGWYLAKEAPWKQLRDYSSVPALLIAIIAAVGIILGYNYKRYAPYRKIFFYLVTLMIVGPGLLVNVILKDNFGRPRPRSITEFGGKYKYEAPLAYDSSSPGKSFPCGHASMGFYIFGIFVLYRKQKKLLARLGLLAGMLWGGLIGYTRMLQGGHFISDVFWSAALVYFTAVMLFYFFKFSEDLKIQVKELPQGKKRVLSAVISILICIIILGVLLATPRDKTHKVRIDQAEYAFADTLLLNLDFYKGDFEIIPSDDLLIQWYFQGFGFPKSNINYNKETSQKNSTYEIDLSQYIRGYFVEMQQDIKLYLPRDKVIILNYTLGKTQVSEIYDEKNPLPLSETGESN